LAELKRALELDPASLPINADFGNFSCLSGKQDEGIEQLKKTIELAPNWPRVHVLLGNCYMEKGMWNEALEEVQKSGAPGFVVRARMYAATGKRDEALKIIAEMEHRPNVSPIGLANIYNALDDKDRTFEWLEKAYAEGTPLLRTLQTGKAWDPLRSDSRFKDLLKRMGLPQQ
jgi:tetratricopeptide (TPR) repeat protein